MQRGEGADEEDASGQGSNQGCRGQEGWRQGHQDHAPRWPRQGWWQAMSLPLTAEQTRSQPQQKQPLGITWHITPFVPQLLANLCCAICQLGCLSRPLLATSLSYSAAPAGSSAPQPWRLTIWNGVMQRMIHLQSWDIQLSVHCSCIL